MARPIRTASLDLATLFSMLLLCGSSYVALPIASFNVKLHKERGGASPIPLQAIIELTTTQAQQPATYTRHTSTPAYSMRQVTLSPTVNASDKVNCLHNNQEKLTADNEGKDAFKQRGIWYINFSMALKNFLIFLSCSHQTNQDSLQVY
jgi:hypothetical protein